MTAATLESVSVARSDDDRTIIARSVLQLLEGLTRRQGKYLEALDHYKGELTDIDSMMTLLLGRCPAVLVVIGGVNYTSKSVVGRRYDADYQIELAVVSQHLTSMEARGVGGEDRFSDAADPGLYKMLSDVRGKLAGRSPNIAGAKRLRPQNEDIIHQGKDISIFASRFSLSMAFCQPRNSDPNRVEATSSEGSFSTIVEQVS